MNSRLIPLTTCTMKQPARPRRSGPITDIGCARWQPVALRGQKAPSVFKRLKEAEIVNFGVMSAPESPVPRWRETVIQAILKQAYEDIARHKASMRMETLISQAETALAWQTPATYRRWFSCWRSEGVGVNDLLNMTWSWRQRTVD